MAPTMDTQEDTVTRAEILAQLDIPSASIVILLSPNPVAALHSAKLNLTELLHLRSLIADQTIAEDLLPIIDLLLPTLVPTARFGQITELLDILPTLLPTIEQALSEALDIPTIGYAHRMFLFIAQQNCFSEALKERARTVFLQKYLEHRTFLLGPVQNSLHFSFTAKTEEFLENLYNTYGLPTSRHPENNDLVTEILADIRKNLLPQCTFGQLNGTFFNAYTTEELATTFDFQLRFQTSGDDMVHLWINEDWRVERREILRPYLEPKLGGLSDDNLVWLTHRHNSDLDLLEKIYYVFHLRRQFLSMETLFHVLANLSRLEETVQLNVTTWSRSDLSELFLEHAMERMDSTSLTDLLAFLRKYCNYNSNDEIVGSFFLFVQTEANRRVSRATAAELLLRDVDTMPDYATRFTQVIQDFSPAQLVTIYRAFSMRVAILHHILTQPE